MKYDTSRLRRREREMEEPAARKLLAEAVYGVLAMQQPGGGAYAVPMNYVWDGERTLYLHCAGEGRKMQCVTTCPQVSMVVTGAVKILPEKFSTAYESLILEGCISPVPEGAEKRLALRLLLQKYASEHMIAGAEYAERAMAHTTVWRLPVDSWCGKRH